MLRLGSVLKLNEHQREFNDSYVGFVLVVEKIVSEKEYKFRTLSPNDNYHIVVRGKWDTRTKKCFDMIEE